MTIFIFAMRVKPGVPDHFIRLFSHQFIYFSAISSSECTFIFFDIPVKNPGEICIGAKPKRSQVELFFFTENKEANCSC